MTSTEDNDSLTSRQTLALLEKNGLPATPENYAVFFHYATGRNKELVREIDSLSSGGKLSKEASRILYHRFIMADRGQKSVDDAAVNAQKILQEVLKAVTDFSGETKHYNQGVDQYMDNISKVTADAGVQEIVKGLITATSAMKETGESMNKKLEASTQEIDSLKKSLQQVTIESQRDFLTGVYNRKAFESLYEERLQTVKENKSDLCLIMIDIDHFKQFNDKFGHLFGDEVLKIVARTLTDTLKGRDIVARFGGEEFVVVLPSTPVDGAMKVAEIIRQTIAGKELKRKDTGQNYGVITVSMGVARLRPDSDNLPALIKRADDALYQAKRSGRNCVMRESV